MISESEITPKYIGFQKSDLSPDEIYVIDTYLQQIESLNATLGKDSNNFEREYVSLKVKSLEQKIKLVSEKFYEQINTPPRDYLPINNQTI